MGGVVISQYVGRAGRPMGSWLQSLFTEYRVMLDVVLKLYVNMLVLASDPGFEPDIKAWSSRTGNTLLSSERQGNEFHALLRKA